jgi:hypothetical protein
MLAAGLLAGVGLAAKLTMGPMLIALVAAILLVGRAPGRWRERVLAVMAFGLGTAVILPWLLRSYLISGTVSGKLMLVLNFIIEKVPGLSVPIHAIVDPGYRAIDLHDFGLGHSPLDLLRIPWVLTFDAQKYAGNSTNGVGDIGIALLLLLPLALFAPRTRATALLAVAALVSYIGWWLTPLQISRHLLPTLALVAALVGIGVANLGATVGPRSRRLLAGAAQVGLVVGLFAVPVFAHHAQFDQVPVGLFTGRESAAEYVAREIPAAAALAAVSATLPPDTPVGYVGKWGGGQLYTETRLMNIGRDTQESIDDQLGTTPEEVLASLERLGITHIIWDRVQTKPEDWKSTLLSVAFLRDHARIVASDPNAYLIEIASSSPQVWGADSRPNLLEDPDLELEEIRRKGGPWTTIGKVRVDQGIVAMRAESFIAQRVSVSAGSPYLFSVLIARCAGPYNGAELTLRWYDKDGHTLSSATERVVPGVEGSEQFVLHRAPDQATSVSAEMASNHCEFDKAALYDLSSTLGPN